MCVVHKQMSDDTDAAKYNCICEYVICTRAPFFKTHALLYHIKPKTVQHGVSFHFFSCYSILLRFCLLASSDQFEMQRENVFSHVNVKRKTILRKVVDTTIFARNDAVSLSIGESGRAFSSLSGPTFRELKFSLERGDRQHVWCIDGRWIPLLNLLVEQERLVVSHDWWPSGCAFGAVYVLDV